MTFELALLVDEEALAHDFEFDGRGYKVVGDKLQRDDGLNAVAYSPGFGAGWSTWTSVSPTNWKVAALVLTGHKDLLEYKRNGSFDPDPESYRQICEFLGMDPEELDYHDGGLRDIKLSWVEPGTLFRISDYDGAEHIVFSNEMHWHIA